MKIKKDFFTKCKIMVVFLFVTVLLCVLAIQPSVKAVADDLNSGLVLYCDFDGSVTDISGVGSTLSIISGDVGSPAFCTDGSGSDSTYMKWTGANVSGGTRIQAEIPVDVSSEYSIAIRFSLGTVNYYKKIVDYSNFASDLGFYVLNGKLQFYGGGNPTGTTSYAADEMIDLIATRDADGTFTVYANKFDAQTGNKTTSVEININNTSIANASKPFTRYDSATGKTYTVIGFLGDDLATNGEYSANGRVYSVKVWNRALSKEEAAVAADPLTLTYTEQGADEALYVESFSPTEVLQVKALPVPATGTLNYVTWKKYHDGWRASDTDNGFYAAGTEIRLDIASVFTAYTQEMVEVQPGKNSIEDSVYSFLEPGEENNSAIMRAIYDGVRRIENIVYDHGKTKDENAAIIAEKGNEIANEVLIKVNTIRFDEYKPTQKAAAEALEQSGDSEACKQLIAQAKAALEAMQFDSGENLADNKARADAVVTELAAVLQTQREKEAFDAYRTEKKAAAEALEQSGDSEACKQLIADAKAELEAMQYDSTKSLDENKAKVDAVVTELAAALQTQRDRDAFDAYRTEKKAVVEAMEQSGDSEACKQLIAQAKAALEAM